MAAYRHLTVHRLYFPVSVLSDPTLATSVYPVCCTAITRSWQYTDNSASVMSEIKKYSQCLTSFMSVCCQTDIYVTSLLSVCRQSVASVLSETLFVRATLILFIFYCTENRKKWIKEKNIQKSFGNRYTASKVLKNEKCI